MELYAIASTYAIPLVPIMKRHTKPFAVFSSLRKFQWVQQPIEYDTTKSLIAQLDLRIISLAKAKEKDLVRSRRAAEAAQKRLH